MILKKTVYLLFVFILVLSGLQAVAQAPGQPGSIQGPPNVTAGTTSNYSISPVSGATSYQWSLSNSSAGTITSGSPYTTVNWSSTFTGTVYISVYGVNSYGSGPSVGQTVSVTSGSSPLTSGTVFPPVQNIYNNSAPSVLYCSAPSGGNGTYTYQWQSSLDNSNWTAISGATTSSYQPQQTVSTYFRLVTTSGVSSVYSNASYLNFMASRSFSPSNNLVSVNEQTGTANVVIPLYTINASHVTFPINLIYSATGIKGSDVEQNAGMGWSVSLGGAVTRQLRGLPDDVSKDIKGNSALGWIYANNGQTINNLSFANDNNTTTCADETTDINALTAAFTGNTDTEPDIFQVNAPGLSCQLIFDKNNVLRVSPYQDLKVSYQTSAQGNPDQGQITSFTITDDKGITYTFSALSTITQTATTTLGSVNYFQSNYNHFKNGITYYSSWGLVSISDVHNNNINIWYTPAPVNSFTNPVQLSVGGAAPTTLYTMAGSITSQLPSNIFCANTLFGQGQQFQITYVNTPNSKESCISNITGVGHDFIFGYNNVSSTPSNYTRLFLNSIIDETCSAQTVNGQTVALSSYAPLNLTFNYLNTSNTASSLAAPGDNNIDYWGYTDTYNRQSSLLPSIDINPSTTGYERYRNRQVTPSSPYVYTYSINEANRETDQKCTIGTLSQINYSAGGYTTFSYEPNQYYDNTLQANVQGGGIRVTKVLDHDGISTDNDFVKNYTYINQSTGNSSGKALSLPIFAFTTPYSGTNTGAALWTSSTMISPVDLSGEDHAILYTSVTETINNEGSTVNQYAVPATNWDNAAPTNPSWSPTGLPAWNPTAVNVGRAQGTGGSCQTEGVLRNDINTYPFPPNINYDFERGLLTNVLKYNNNGTQVSEADYFYQTPETPIDITALRYDVNSYATNYAKYTIHTSARPQVSQIVDKVFDLTGLAPGAQPTAAQVVTTNNVYNTAQHKLTQQTVINSDGSKNIQYFKYAKDYTITTAGDSYLSSLLAIQNDNVNIPVETYTQFIPVNGTQAVTTGADLILFGTFANQGADYLAGNNQNEEVVQVVGPAPLQHRKFISVNGVADFSPSTISNTNTLQFDSRYTVTENDLGYDYSGFLLSKDDGFQHVTTKIYDNANSFRLRAALTNVRFDQIGLDFPVSGFQFFHYINSPNAYNFSATNGVVLGSVTRNGEPSFAISASQGAGKTLTKNPAAKNYIFSTWVNAATAGKLSVTATDGTNTSTGSFGFDATVANSKYPTGFEYCRIVIPITNLTASSTITISFSSNQNINCTDVFTYPDIAGIIMYSYDSNNNKIAETNGNGVSTYYSYDGLGRLLFVYDQDDNIIERKTYVNNNAAINSTPSVNLSWSSISGYSSNQESIQFNTAITGNNTCTFNGNTLYSWNYGDGSPAVNGAALVSPNHTYNGAQGQKFTCTLTITSPENSVAPYSVSTVVTL